MRKFILLLTLCSITLNCSVNKKPEFLRVENIQVLESTSEYLTLTADALFLNPNDIAGQLKTDGIKVLVNDNQMATVTTESFKVPAKKEFSIPLQAKIPIDSIISNKNIGDLLGSLFSKKLKVQYVGDIKYKVLGFSHTYKIDKTEDVKIKF